MIAEHFNDTVELEDARTLASYRLEPDGLVLSRPAVLRIVLPADEPPEGFLFFLHTSATSEELLFAIVEQEPSATRDSVSVELSHFSRLSLVEGKVPSDLLKLSIEPGDSTWQLGNTVVLTAKVESKKGPGGEFNETFIFYAYDPPGPGSTSSDTIKVPKKYEGHIVDDVPLKIRQVAFSLSFNEAFGAAFEVVKGSSLDTNPLELICVQSGLMDVRTFVVTVEATVTVSGFDAKGNEYSKTGSAVIWPSGSVAVKLICEGFLDDPPPTSTSETTGGGETNVTDPPMVTVMDPANDVLLIDENNVVQGKALNSNGDFTSFDVSHKDGIFEVCAVREIAIQAFSTAVILNYGDIQAVWLWHDGELTKTVVDRGTQQPVQGASIQADALGRRVCFRIPWDGSEDDNESIKTGWSAISLYRQNDGDTLRNFDQYP